jgi:SAM-dependent methyltransferase
MMMTTMMMATVLLLPFSSHTAPPSFFLCGETRNEKTAMTSSGGDGEGRGYGYRQGLEYVTEYWRDRFERENGRNWDKFYRGSASGYVASTKSREYLVADIGEDALHGRKRVLEIGCGAGHSIAPLAKANPALEFFAIDVSARAVELLRTNEDVPTRDGRC